VKDEFICPNNERIKFRFEYFDKCKKKNVRIYKGVNCGECKFRKNCIKNKKGIRTIKCYGSKSSEMIRREMSRKFETTEGREKYKTRAKIVECIFGDVKQNIGLREFLTRGVKGVKTEFNLACIAHNLKRIWSFIRNTNLDLRSVYYS
jgi:transposase